jgi:hypothetical protein
MLAYLSQIELDTLGLRQSTATAWQCSAMIVVQLCRAVLCVVLSGSRASKPMLDKRGVMEKLCGAQGYISNVSAQASKLVGTLRLLKLSNSVILFVIDAGLFASILNLSVFGTFARHTLHYC